MNLPDVTPTEAKRRLDGEEAYLYLDVRTVAEFEAGHVGGALNIPIALVNDATGGMEANPEFLPVVRANIPKDARVIVGCRSGGRSARAGRVLLDAGYQHVVNMVGGFLAKTDSTGAVVQPGWSMLKFPVAVGDDDASSSYESLRLKVTP